MSVSVRCHAKLNLFLKVYGKRPDGFHDIISVMQSIDLADRLLLEQTNSEGIEIVCSRPGVPLDNSNLVWKAAELLSRETGYLHGGLKIRIEKDIPVMAGLAGGSADAAGALEALRKLWKLEIDDTVLYSLAGKLGSDVPFCLLGGTAIAGGRGEVLEPFPTGLADRLPDTGAFVVITPPIQVETKGAYDLLDRMREKETRNWSSLWEEHSDIREVWNAALIEGNFSTFFTNDFEEPVLGSIPELASIHAHLRNSAGHALLSGSGASMFAYFPVTTLAIAAAESYVPLNGESALVAFPVGRGVELDG